MRKLIRILGGLHTGATVALEEGVPCIIGSDPSCSVVLCDSGVSRKHCVVVVNTSGTTCTALEDSIAVDGIQVPIGQTVGIVDFQEMRCGDAIFSVGLPNTEWPSVGTASSSGAGTWQGLLSLTASRPLRYFRYAIAASAVLGIAGLAYAVVSESRPPSSGSHIEEAQRWLKSIAPADSELVIVAENARHFLLSGYVATDYQRELITALANDSKFRPRLDVYAAEEIVASLQRLTQLEGVPCVPQYIRSGQVACTNAVVSEGLATNLQSIAKQIPGLTALDVRIAPPAPPPIVAAPPVAPVAPPPPEPDPGPHKLARKFSVVMSKHERYIVGEYGDKYGEGDEFDGFTVRRIDLDQVRFARNGREFRFPMGALQ